MINAQDFPDNLTQTVVSIVCQAEAVVARAPVVSWDVDALVDTPSIVFGHAFVYICRENMQQNVKVSNFWNTDLAKKHIYLFCSSGEKKNQYQLQAKQSLAAKSSVWVQIYLDVLLV